MILAMTTENESFLHRVAVPKRKLKKAPIGICLQCMLIQRLPEGFKGSTNGSLVLKAPCIPFVTPGVSRLSETGRRKQPI